MEFVRDENVDILFLTETWMETQGDEGECVDLTPQAANCSLFPGGGLAVTMMYRDHFPVTVNTTFPFARSSFELVALTLTAPDHIHFFCLCRSPPGKRNRLTDSDFLTEVPDFFDFLNFFSAVVNNVYIL